MNNYKLLLEYNGENFSGSQIQPDARTVQGELEAGLSKYFDASVETCFSSRTDAGVHAIGQVVNFKTEKELEGLDTNPDKLLIALNSFLPNDMALVKIGKEAEDFHARFDAKSREYLYKIFIRRHRPVLRLDSLAWVKEPLDFDLMQEKAKSFIGEQDFANYAKAAEIEIFAKDGSVATVEKQSTICNVLEAELIKESKLCYKFRIKANRFLRHMVRRMVGDLVSIGRGDGSDPTLTMPANALTLVSVEY